MPYTVFGEDDNAPAERVPIEELLAADEYKEGEVLAVMKPSSSVFSDQGEELITDLYRNSVRIESKIQYMNCLMTLWLLLKSSGN